jgi:putative membrane protein
MMGYGAGSGSAGLMWGLGGMLLIVGLVVLVVWAVSRGTSNSAPSASPDRLDAQSILRARFARGEITEAEFVQAKKVLGDDR